MSEADIRDAMASGMNAEGRRRQLASQRPGYGALVPLGQPPSGPGVGITDVPGLDVTGEGYDIQAEISAAVHKSYGESRPVYAAPEVGGSSYSRRSIIAEMADRAFGRQDAAEAAPGVVYVSPQAAPRPSLWSRLRGRRRR